MTYSGHGTRSGARAAVALLAMIVMADEAYAQGAGDRQIAQAEAVLHSLQTGDPAAITENIDPAHYTQHNLGFPDGRQALLDALPRLVAAGTTVRVVRGFADGPFVVTHSVYTRSGKRFAGFDVFRFDQDRIVEHWDNQQTLGEAADAGATTMIDGPSAVEDSGATDLNKAAVKRDVLPMLVDRCWSAFPTSVPLPADYLDHDTSRKKGDAAPVCYGRLERMLGAGNFVLLMSSATVDGNDAAAYDLLRLRDGRFVEHWDTVAAIPPRSQWRNDNGKF